MGLQSVSVAVARDVMSVAGERAPATTTDGLTASLAELVELTTDCRALVSHDGNGTLTVRTSGGTSRLAVERTKRTGTQRMTPPTDGVIRRERRELV